MTTVPRLDPELKTSDSMVLPAIRRLSDNHFCAAFELMKILPARFIMDVAEKNGDLGPNITVVESSSGTFALGLAILCAERGYKLVIVGDNAIDAGLKNRLTDLGVHIDLVAHTDAPGGIQKARLDRLQTYLDGKEKYFWPRQYENPGNAQSYYLAAEKISETIGAVDYLVATVGSGGSSQGLTRALRVLNPRMKLIGVDSLKSTIFGRKDDKRILRGLGSSILPQNVAYELFDQVHFLDCKEGFYAMRQLHKKHQMFMGPTSGAAHLVGEWLTQEHQGAKILSVFPDSGNRYINTAYDDDWLKDNNALTQAAGKPFELKQPSDTAESWCYYNWNKQSLKQAIGR
jgi:cysteine synthase A